jgi:hypothetical protein
VLRQESGGPFCADPVSRAYPGCMGSLIVLAAVAAAGGVAALVGRAVLRRRPRQRDDMKRVGDDAVIDPRAAALRAQGKAAWMRMSGF